MSKIALIIGHSRSLQGAVNKTYGTSEFEFNEPLAYAIAVNLIKQGYEPRIIYRDCSYADLPQVVNDTNADIAVSLHANAYNENPNGSEMLYYKDSAQGFLLASCIQEEIVKCLDLKDRGLKPCVAAHMGKAGDRGGSLLQGTNMPCVIAEPFFIDSDTSLELANLNFEALAEAYTTGIVRYLRG